MLESGVSELLQSFWVFMKQLTLTVSELQECSHNLGAKETMQKL